MSQVWEVAIIGGGMLGLAIAYNLARCEASVFLLKGDGLETGHRRPVWPRLR